MKLANGIISFDFDENTGSLRQITDLKTGKRYLHDPHGYRLVKLIAPTAEYSTRPLYSHLAGPPRMQKKDETLTIDFPQMRADGKSVGISMQVKVHLPAGSPEAFFTLELRNDGPEMVQEVWFPWIGGHHMEPGDKRETVTVGANVPNFSSSFPLGHTHTFGRHHQRLGFSCNMPMLDISDAQGGLSYIRYENRVSYNAMVFENLSNDYGNLCMSWAWASRPFLKTGQSWTSAEFGVGVHQGDWHTTADRLRGYMKKWWKPSGMPHFLHEKIGLYHVQFHGFNGEPYNEFAVLPEMARDCLQYGVADICLWDVAAQVYLRPDPGGFWEMTTDRLATLKRALAASRQLGCRVGAWVNFRLITEYTRLWTQMERSALRSIYGQPITDNWPGSMNHAVYLNGLIHQAGHALCQGSDGFRKFAFDLVERTMALGFSTLYIDQAAEWNSCLTDSHGHQTPAEAMKKTYEWFGEATRRVRELCPEAYTVGELPDLYNTQSIDLWWDWGWRSHAATNVFRYLMPETMYCWCIDENERDVLSKAFALGDFLAIATRDMTGRLSDEPELAAQIARLARLRKATAPFVSHGQFLDDRGLKVQGGDGYVYTSPRGLAVTLANGKPRATRMKVTLSPAALGRQVGSAGTLFVEGEKPHRVTPERRGDAWSFTVALPPYGAGVLTLSGHR